MKWMMTILALGLVAGCGDAKRTEFERTRDTFLNSESNLARIGCNLTDTTVEETALDCSGAPMSNPTALSSSLNNYVDHATEMLESDAKAEGKFMTHDQRLRIKAKINVANKIRGTIAKLKS